MRRCNGSNRSGTNPKIDGSPVGKTLEDSSLLVTTTVLFCKQWGRSVPNAAASRFNATVLSSSFSRASFIIREIVLRSTLRVKRASQIRNLLIVLIEANETLAETFYFWYFLLRIESETLFS